MKELINISNYEAFYLDYLEGTLDAVTEGALLEFLEKNPELKIDEDLPSLVPSSLSDLDSDFKASLLMYDEQAIVTEENAELFMIAQVEGIILPEKEKELKQVIASHAELQKDLTYYQLTKLSAEQSILFEGKDELKKRAVIIPLYMKRIAVAASVLLLVGLYFMNSDKLTTQAKQFGQESQKRHKNDKPASINEIPSVMQIASVESTAKQKTLSKNKLTHSSIAENIELASLSKLPSISLKNIPSQVAASEFNDEFYTVAKVAPEPEKENKRTLVNPIPFITNTLASKTKKDVNFLVAKEEKVKTKRFYVKFGKFEFSRNVNQKDDLATN